MGTKEKEIKLIKNRLYGLWSFIAQYLPLANSQVCDFIVNDLWEEIPSQIQEELLLMSDSELASLPSQTVKTSPRTDTVEKPKKMSETCDIRQIACPFLISSTASCQDASGSKQETSLQQSLPMWKLSTLDAFVEEAQRHVLDSDVLTTCSELQADWSCDTAGVSDRLPGVLMSQKKCHEVDVMAELCAQLSKRFRTNLTVDLGSGKGYLSTQLCCEFGHCVIGIDAAQTNTTGATKRADKLTQDWKAYSGNIAKCTRKRCDKSEEKQLLKTVNQDISKAIPSAGSVLPETSDKLSSKLDHFSDLAIETTLNENTNSNSAIHCSGNYPNPDVMSSLVRKQELEEYKVCDEFGKEGKQSSSTASCPTPEIDSTQEPPKKDPKSNWSDKFIPLTKFVDPDMNLMDSIKDATEQLQLDPNCVRILLTGLHTCGGLGASILKMFVNSESVSVLCNVACCYNLLEEEFVSNTEHTLSGSSGASHFPMSSYLRHGEVGLGKAARNVACLSVHRMAVEDKLQGYSFYPRVLLQKIILDSGQRVLSETIKLRKLQKRSKSLYEYVRMAFTKLGLQTDKITPELVESYDMKYEHVKRQLAVFVQLRAVLAPCIEAFILLDRYLYLLEQDNVKYVHLSKVFDPVVSPRCYALIAIKDTKSD